MRRRSKAGNKPVKIRRRKMPAPKRHIAPKAASRHSPDAAGNETEVARLTSELDNVLGQQAATSEVLRIISASPGDLKRVFDVILKSATRLCNAKFGTLYLYDGKSFAAVATHNAPPAYVEFRMRGPINPGPGTALYRVVRTKRPVHIPDITKETAYRRGDPIFTTAVKLGGYRSLLSVPILRKGELIGALGMQRQEVRPFTDKQIGLLKNFAAQAVIAIENTRLLSELRQSLEQQTATAQVLSVISSSPAELGPVFQSMLENATRICEANFGTIYRYDGKLFHTVASRDEPSALVEFRRQRGAFVPVAGQPLDRLLRTRAVVRSVDDTTEPVMSPAARLGGARSHISVPMFKDNELVGAITLYRREVRPFTEKQIALVQNFATQAVIAIENTRLLGELRQSLEQQTATSEVLGVISSSPGDLAPVFQTMLSNATRICGAKIGILFRYVDGSYTAVSTLGVAPAYADYLNRGPIRPGPTTGLGRLAATRQTIHVEDTKGDRTYADREPFRVATAELGGARSLLTVPMLKDSELIGAIGIYRQEVRPFTDEQVALVTDFAAQAVIAIENTRLLSELRESLDQQTATSNVLEVISRSAFDLQAVFDTVAESSARLCDADRAFIFRFDGEVLRLEASYNASAEFMEWVAQHPIRPGRHSASARAALERRTIHIPDVRTDPEYTYGAKDAEAIRTVLGVPILKGDALLGVLMIYHLEVRPFSNQQIALVETFADQAAIAIENVRLFEDVQKRTEELSDALEQQTATSDVLRVISSSPGDLVPVFRAMLANAAGVCDAKFGMLFRIEERGMRPVASLGVPEQLMEFFRQPLPPSDDAPIMRVARTKQPAHVIDFATEPAYIRRNPVAVASVEIFGVRTLLVVPMLKENEMIGAFAIYRQEVRPFTEKQIELVQNFAAQAVIAIENTRLLSELRESLEQQTATSEVLSVISRSPGDLKPVFATMLANATRLCEAKFGTFYRPEDGGLRLIAAHDVPPAFAEAQTQRPFYPAPDTVLGQILSTGRTVHMDDLAATRAYAERDPAVVTAIEVGGIRTAVGVPMFKDGELTGVVAIYRQEVRPFTEKQVELVTNFAAQAVIAIENTRLLSELRESLEQQTATSEVLSVISSSPGDLQPVFDTMLESAVTLCDARFGNLFLYDGEAFQTVALHRASPAYADVRRQGVVVRHLHPDVPLNRVVQTREVIHIADVRLEQCYLDRDPTFVALVDTAGARTLLVVPLLKENELVGAFAIYRLDVRPFADKQIDLVKSFAAQAVIAIENTRLLNELRQRTTDLSASLDDLRTAQDRLVQTEKLASLGQLTAGIAHEIKNPLNFVNNFSSVSVELLDELQEAVAGVKADDKTSAEIAELADTLRGNLEKIVQHGKRADSIVKNMLLHSREGSGEHRSVDINAVVEESLNLAYHGARAEKEGFNITLLRSFDPAAGEVDLYPQEITRVLLNLISNGFYAATKRKGQANNDSYEPTLTAATKNLGDRVEIRIRDNGTGIPAEVKDKMFNPFFTTKPAGEGTGLGLSISHDIVVKQHAGSIAVDTEPGQFTEFRIVLPRNAAAVAKSGGNA
jgi:GAF domain-containing protein